MSDVIPPLKRKESESDFSNLSLSPYPQSGVSSDNKLKIHLKTMNNNLREAIKLLQQDIEEVKCEIEENKRIEKDLLKEIKMIIPKPYETIEYKTCYTKPPNKSLTITMEPSLTSPKLRRSLTPDVLLYRSRYTIDDKDQGLIKSMSDGYKKLKKEKREERKKKKKLLKENEILKEKIAFLEKRKEQYNKIDETIISYKGLSELLKP